MSRWGHNTPLSRQALKYLAETEGRAHRDPVVSVESEQIWVTVSKSGSMGRLRLKISSWRRPAVVSVVVILPYNVKLVHAWAKALADNLAHKEELVFELGGVVLHVGDGPGPPSAPTS